MDDLATCAEKLPFVMAISGFLIFTGLGVYFTSVTERLGPAITGFILGCAAVPTSLILGPSLVILFVVGTFGMGSFICAPFW